MKKIILFLLVCFSNLIADDYSETNRKWDDFENELECFFHYSNPANDLTDTNDEDLENYFKEKRIQEHNALVESVNNAQQAFLNYREKMGAAIAATVGQSRHGYSLHSLVEGELTSLHIEYLKKKLFPEGWKSECEASAKLKTSWLLGQPGSTSPEHKQKGTQVKCL